MNYLELCQFVVLEADISNGGPTTVLDQQGDFHKVTRWVSNAWSRIQSDRRQWEWMRREFRMPLVEGQVQYGYGECNDKETGLPLARWSDWFLTNLYEAPYSLQINGSSTTKRDCTYIRWADWRQLDYDIADNTQSYPSYFTINPQRKLVVYPIPSEETYELNGEYRISPQILTNDADVPEGIDDSLHELIAWQALVYYGYEAIAQEILALAHGEIRPLMQQMRRDYLPQITSVSSGRTLVP